MDPVEERFGDDWYGRNPDWGDDLLDLGERESGEEDGSNGSREPAGGSSGG